MLKAYLKEIHQTYSRGDAREESYYPALKKLIEKHGEKEHNGSIHTTILPKKTEAGNPDFRIWDGKQKIVGYIEAKAPSVKNLDSIESSEQLKRYRATFPNLILTNFYEFRLYRDGDLISTVTIARKFLSERLKTLPPLENIEEYETLIRRFLSFSTPAISNAEELAIELAKRTRFLRDEVIYLELQEKDRNGIHGFFEAFQKYLITNLNETQFADLYSQTITYGLFASRTRAANDFSRELAFKYIPKTIGILRDVFRFVSLEEPPKSLQVIVDDIADILRITDVRKILHDYYSKGRGKDPIIHFYETFLAKYDPKLREMRGVYYTPEPVVDYIVGALNTLLNREFSLEEGIADKSVTVLDPAGGTLTFITEAIKIAVNDFVERYGKGGLSQFIKGHILKDFYSFELMMAPYAIGHLKFGFILEELGYSLKESERANLYLTNTLEMEEIEKIHIPGISSLSEESHLAGKIKKIEPILVILGNPPYSGISANINEWTEELLKKNIDGALSYYEVNGESLGERKLWLQDDYVKFLRFAQWKIHKAGKGVVGMITNHAYLSNPTFRGMRFSLMNTFDKIYILDLHGNKNQKETTPDGERDDNVFDIRQGVSIALFVKTSSKSSCKVYHTDLYGTRDYKYSWLSSTKFADKIYNKLNPTAPWYMLHPSGVNSDKNYLSWPNLKTIFPINNVGIVTARDKFAIDTNKDSLAVRIRQFRDLRYDENILKEAYKLKDTSTFKLTKFREELSKDKDWNSNFQTITYRPFDNRHIYYSKWVVERPIHDTMRHMLHNNIALCFMRQFSGNSIYTHVLLTEHMVDNRTFFSNKGIIQIAPLYLYKDPDSNDLFASQQEDVAVNISDDIYQKLKSAISHKLSPEDVLYYVYAIMNSPSYRTEYSEQLRIDFPRIPFTIDKAIFNKIVVLGKKLGDLHLLKGAALGKQNIKYFGTGDNDNVDKVTYDDSAAKLFINNAKYFYPISKEVWEFELGGYQSLAKYLKDRKGQRIEDTSHVCRIASAIEGTINIQKDIDNEYKSIENVLNIEE